MKEERVSDRQREDDEEKIDVQELLFKYIIHWPWFVGAVIVCLMGAWAYLHMATPVYNISATVLIKDDKKGGNTGTMSGLEELGLSGLINSSQNIDNEIEVLRSKTLVKEVISQLNLYVAYRDEDEFPAKNMYKTSPIQVSLTPQEAEKLSDPMAIEMTLHSQGSLDVNVMVGEKEYQKHFEKLPAVFPMDEGTLAFFQNTSDSLSSIREAEDASPVHTVRHITATISQPMKVARSYCANLTIEPTSKTTSVAVISLKNSSLRRGQDFINQLLEMYNRNTNNDKNEIAQKTAEFIDERIGIISKELGSTEANLESFKRDAGITDLTSEAQIALAGNAEYEKKSVENRTQISLVNDLRKYLRGNEYEVLPSNVGLQDAALIGAIERYNEMLVERKRLLRTSTENNPTIVNLDTSIRAMKANVQATLEGTLQGLMITKESLDREASRYSRRISNAPGQERAYVSIARQQEIKAGLYLMLLQKREENAIALAATANNAKIIDEAIADDIPVSPKRSMIYLIALVLGIGIPVGIIYLIELTKFKIEGRARGPEYVRLVTECYKEAVRAYCNGTFDEKKVAAWDERLRSVFNRGFWDGYYLGQRLGEWSSKYGSGATKKKVYVAKGIKYFDKIGVAEFEMESGNLKVGDEILITGPTTGAVMQTIEEIRVDLKPVDETVKGERFSLKVNEKIRPSDRLYKMEKVQLEKVFE